MVSITFNNYMDSIHHSIRPVSCDKFRDVRHMFDELGFLRVVIGDITILPAKNGKLCVKRNDVKRYCDYIVMIILGDCIEVEIISNGDVVEVL